MKKAIIFDWSGVVRDTTEAHLWIVNKMFEKYNISLTMEEYLNNWKQPYMLFYNKYVPSMTIEEENMLYEKASVDPNCPKSKAYSGMPELIKKLKEKDYFLCVVTSDLEKTFLKDLEEYNLLNIFDIFETNIHDKNESVKKIILENNLDLDNTFFIGDSNHEVEVAKKLGIKSIAVTWGFTTKENLSSLNPDYLVDNVKELENILL